MFHDFYFVISTIIIDQHQKVFSGVGNGPTKFIPINNQATFGRVVGFSGVKLGFGDSVVTRHGWHCFTNRSASVDIASHHTLVRRRAFVLAMP